MDENMVDLEGKCSKYCATWQGAAETMRAKKAELKQLKEKLQVTDLCTHPLTHLLTHFLERYAFDVCCAKLASE